MYGRKKDSLLWVGTVFCVILIWFWMLRKCISQATYLQQKVQNPNMWNWISVQCPLLILIWCPVMDRSFYHDEVQAASYYNALTRHRDFFELLSEMPADEASQNPDLGIWQFLSESKSASSTPHDLFHSIRAVQLNICTSRHVHKLAPKAFWQPRL